MLRSLISLTAAVVAALSCSTVSAQTTYSAGVVTFDDLSQVTHVSAVVPSYQGFAWGNGFVTWSDVGHPSMYTTFQANSGTSIARADHQGFYFDGADFFLRDGAGTNDIYLFLYDQNGNTLYHGFDEKFGKNHIVDTDRLQTFGAVVDVDKVTGAPTFYSGLVYSVAFSWDNNNLAKNANDFGMDNFRYRAADAAAITEPGMPQVSAVPEIETYTMLLAGFGLMGTIIRRRQRNA